ncbi:uncharacterized protein DDB_G0271670 [Tetranychus urticae]|uniref:Uncharacterized protein n=1 Tax=Tetranychus urticae TaxID=32264 RepID=T1KF80_TETUR|nr:uncharacterized protein DDB_G0271670 [Tetranychus urticae]XP_015786413.1 uncharacterized protein DDB_G0271670 [Tetranychus urticae]
MLPEAGSKKVDFDDYLGMVPDYDAEYDSIESRLAPISISAREEAASNGPDNLPGYPPPNGTALDQLHQHDSADLAADGAGFIFESPAIVKSTSSSSPSSSLSSPTSSSDSSISAPSSSSSSPSSSLPKPAYGTRTSLRNPLPNKSHSRLSLYNSPNQDSYPILSQSPSFAEAPSSALKTFNPQPLSKLAQQQIVTTPSLTLSKSRSKLASIAARADAISKQAASHQRHSLLQSQTPIIDYNSPLITHLLRSAQHQESALGLPGFTHQRLPTIRITPESETYANPLLAHTLSSNLAANFGNIAAAKSNLGDYHARTPASPIFSSTHFGMPAIRSKRSTDSEDQSETETQKPGIENILPLEHNEDDKKMDQNNNKHSEGENLDNGEKKNLSSNSNDTNGNDNDLLKSEASGYFAFDDEDPELASLFNLDNSFDKPSPMKTPFSLTSSDRRSRKRRPQTYFPATAQTTKQNFGILGSGNFEIIRGGIYSEDEVKSGSDTHYARGMSETVKSSNSDFDDYNDGSLSSKVPYSTEEYFSNNPVLGFQGYDNFKAASNQQKTIGPNESRRESTASDSSENLHVFVDHELMAAS